MTLAFRSGSEKFFSVPPRKLFFTELVVGGLHPPPRQVTRHAFHRDVGRDHQAKAHQNRLRFGLCSQLSALAFCFIRSTKRIAFIVVWQCILAKFAALRA
jgi:hypothetical protein